jgi:hypothetical protein
MHLKRLIAGSDIQYSDSFEIDGGEVFAHACRLGLEGVDAPPDTVVARKWPVGLV